MNIAQNLKRLRIDKGLTQNELAERIGVTGQAVGKWERDECYPDITLLPGLANFFGVTTDELLGMSEIKNKLWGVHARANALQIEGKYHEAAAVYDEALQTFPADSGLTMGRANTLAMAGEGIGNAIAVCERRLQEALDDHARSGVVTVLCFLYKATGQADKAEALARRRPHARDSRELLLPCFLVLEERAAYVRKCLPGILTDICDVIDGVAHTTEEQLRRTILGRYDAPVSAVEAVRKIEAFLAAEDCNGWRSV